MYGPAMAQINLVLVFRGLGWLFDIDGGGVGGVTAKVTDIVFNHLYEKNNSLFSILN